MPLTVEDRLKDLLVAERNDFILPRARVAASHERWLAENQAADFLLPPGKQLQPHRLKSPALAASMIPFLSVFFIVLLVRWSIVYRLL